MKLSALLLSTALATCFSFSAFAQGQPVATVTLSTSGLGEYTRPVTGENGVYRAEMVARLSEMDDVLKSLVVLGEDIEGATISVGSSQALSDVFETIPFSPSDLSAPAALLSRLPGVDVRLTHDERVLEGRVMGVAFEEACGLETGCPPVVMVLTDGGGVARLALWDDVAFEILDPDTRALVARGLDALQEHGNENTRTVSVEIDKAAGSSSPVMISTVLQAPIWKPAYRGVIADGGGIDLQAWAVVENASGEDWDDVVLTLTSGNPQTLDANLYARTYANRPSSDQASQMLKQSLMGSGNAFARSAPMADMMMESAPMEIAAVPAQTQAQEGAGGARFTFDEPVSIAAGEVSSVPFLGGALEAQMVGYRRGGQPNYQFEAPSRVLDVKNTLDVRLPSGIATLYHVSDGYLGDANIPEIHPNENRILPFGQETRLRVKETVENNDIEWRMRHGDGVLIVETQRVIDTSYELKGPEAGVGRMLIDHPERPGFSVEVRSGQKADVVMLNRSENVSRFDISLDAGESERITIRETMPQSQRFTLSSMSEDQLFAFASRSPDRATKRYLELLVDARRYEGRAFRAVQDYERERAGLVAEQERLSGLLENLAQGSAAHDRFSSQILELEDSLTALDNGSEELKKQLQVAQETIRDLLSQ